jgi:hypothetical protein
VVLPAVHAELCSERVLVIEWLDGVSLREAGQLIDDRGLDQAELTRALLYSMVYQIIEGGVFHADPHRATSCYSPTGASPCSTSAQSVASTPSRGPRCSSFCLHSGGATLQRSATLCWI